MSSLSTPKRRFGGRRALLAGGIALAVFTIPAVAYGAGTFTDVSSKNAYYKDVKAATTSGVMAGCSKTKFCPKTAATRQDVARLANRLGALTPGLKPIVNAKTALTAAAALHAATADNATNAGHATSADSATSATDSAALGGVAASGYVKNAGQVLVTATTNGWSNFSNSSPATVTYYSDTTRFNSSTATGAYLETGFAVPTAIYGNQMAVAGVQLCYNASNGASIGDVFLNRRTASAGVGGANFVTEDPTSRTDSVCRTYAVATPVTLGVNDSITLFLQVSFGANTYIDVPTATLILVPTGSGITPLSRPLSKGPLTVMKPLVGRSPFASH